MDEGLRTADAKTPPSLSLADAVGTAVTNQET